LTEQLRKRTRTAALVAGGAVLGFAAALPVTYILKMRTAEANLQRHAHHVLKVTEGAAEETRVALKAVRDDRLPFCSDDDLALMRRIAYNGLFVRDLGRTKDGQLYCTSTRGRFSGAIPRAEPAFYVLDLRDDLTAGVSPNHGLAISPGITGIIVQSDDVSVVVNPSPLMSLEEGPIRATELAYDRRNQTVLYLFGSAQILTGAQVVAQHPIEFEKVYYQPLCSDTYSVCIIVSEAKADMAPHRAADFIGPSILGACLGMLLALADALFGNRQQSFERQVRRAVKEQKITCVFQPIVDLTSGRIVGAETLARWRNDSGEQVPPDAFIEIAEQKGFVGEITRLVIRRTIEELGPLLHEPDFCSSINIAPSDLVDPAFVAYVDRCLVDYRIPASALGFELTERGTTDRSSAREAVARLRAAGHAVHIDDFGTGYSSLAYLHELHVDAIKIDRAFTSTVGTDAVTASVVPHILEMALQFRLTVVIEGIETAEQAQYFRNARDGILGQGWLFGKPVPAAEFLALFKRNRSLAAGA
jgi:sensor c-di-GMP phosphodiesterase-like protein